MEFLAWWFLAGVAMDFLVMLAIKTCMNAEWDRYCKEKGIDRNAAPMHTVIEIAKESPWWGHAIIIMCPPAGLLRIAMED